MYDNYGQFFYPGIEAYDSVNFTDVSGIAPTVIVVDVYPQEGIPDRTGDVVLTYNSERIVIPNCVLDAASISYNSGGQMVSVRLLDERWRWKDGQITGKYNFRLPNNFVDPRHEKTPRELAAILFEAMGVTNYNASVLPADARTEVDWICANPAEELAKLCDQFGCRIVPQRSTGTWWVRVTGEGAFLPDDFPYMDGGDGIDPKEIPDFIQIVTAPVNYQVALKLQAIGKDLDLSWVPVADLTYRPVNSYSIVNGVRVDDPGFGFGTESEQMGHISNVRTRLGDGTGISPRELALQTVFRAWRISTEAGEHGGSDEQSGVDGDPAVWIDGYDDYVTRKQIILSDKLVQAWTDDRGGVHNRPSFIWGEFESHVTENVNTKKGTRIDYQGVVYRQSPEEPASFSVALDPIDTDRSIITTSRQLRFSTQYAKPPSVESLTVFDAAKIFYTSAIQIRDPETWQPIMYYRSRQIGSGTDMTNVMTIVKNDIQPWFINLYNNDGTFLSNTNNSDEVNKQCDYFLDAIGKTLETIGTSQRTYIGLYAIDMDGAIQQVSYRMGSGGYDTIVSRGTEHNYEVPDYEARRQRDGRRNIAEKLKLDKEISARRVALMGTFNT